MIKKDYKEDYVFVLNSGMFWEFYPSLSGNWDSDKSFWNKMRRKQERERIRTNGSETLKKQENSDTLNEVISDMIAREKLGLKKYGTTIDRDDYSLRDWLQNTMEEHMDSVLYLKRAIMEIDKTTKNG